MIRFYFIIAIIIFTLLTAIIGCGGAVANFVVGASGNVFSDTINRELEKQINSDCKGRE